MTPQEAQELQVHLEAAAAILFKNTPAEQLQDFESIECSVRDQVLKQVSPRIGNFFRQRHPNECRTQATGAELPRGIDGEPQASRQTGLKEASAPESPT